MVISRKSQIKSSEGFSLLEVAVSLLIFSISVVTIYQIVISTQVSSQSMKEKVIAREIANNRYAIMETIDYPASLGMRSGVIMMAGQEWIWQEKTRNSSQYLNEFSIIISNKESGQVMFVKEGFIEKR